MSINEVDIAGIVTVNKLDGSPLEVEEVSFGWGIDAGGSPYFDPNGAAPGEQAQLGIDQNGNVFLER
jgi:hypothetical protein